MKPRNPHASALRHFKPKLVKDKRQDEKRKAAESEARNGDYDPHAAR